MSQSTVMCSATYLPMAVAMPIFSGKLRACSLALVTMLMLVGCDRANVKWSEEVRLADGQIIIAARTAQGKTYSELGGTGGWRDPVEMSVLIVKTPGNLKSPPEWRDTYVPALLDHDASNNTWSIVATFYYCETWNALGKPIPPYIEYQSINGAAWQRVALEERFIDRETNLLTGPSTDGEPSLVTIKGKELSQRSVTPMYKRILRKWGREEDNNCDS